MLTHTNLVVDTTAIPGHERVAGQADGVVPRYKVQSSCYNIEVDFYQEGTKDEGARMVHLARVLGRLEEITEMGELRLRLSDRRWADGQCQKHGEEAELHLDARVFFNFLEGEAIEQVCEDVQGEFVDCVLGDALVQFTNVGCTSGH